MTGTTQLGVSGITGALSKAGIGIGSTPAELKTAAPNGAGTDFMVHGIAYHFADDATFAMTAMAVQAAETSCLYLLQINAAGTTSTKKGREILTADIPESDALEWPVPDEDNCALGYFRVDTVGVTYTGATTDLDASGITDTYYDVALGIPATRLAT